MSLRESAADGIRWTTASMVVTTSLQLLRLVLLGRVLEPGDFGLMAMLLIVIGFAELLAQMGLGEAIIQRQDPTQLELSSLYWLNVGLSGIFYLALLLVSPVIASIYSEPELERLLPWVALVFLISPWGNQFRVLLQKRLQFRPVAIIDICVALVGTIITVILAWDGYGVWSLVVGMLIQSAVGTLLLLGVGQYRGMLPRLQFQGSAVKPYLSFGLHLVGSNMTNYINSRVDQLVLGAMLGSQALGYYTMAFNLVLQPIYRINPVLTQVAFPVMSSVAGDLPRLKRGYFKMLDLLTSINAPLLLGVAVVAPLLVPNILGDKWLPMVPLVQILAIFALIRSTGNVGGSLVLAVGRADFAFYWNLVLLVFIPVTVFFGAFLGGLIGVAFTLLGLQLILLFSWYYFVVRRLLGSCFIGYIGAIGRPIAAAAIMVIVLLMVLPMTSSLPDFIVMISQVLLGGGVYALIYVLLRKEFVRGNINLFFNRS